MEYIKLFKQLHEYKIQYLVCGGLAVNIYGIPRMTADIDLLINFEHENVKRFVEAVEKLHFTPNIPLQLPTLSDKNVREDMIKNRNLIAYSFYNTQSNYMNLDVLIDTPITFDKMWENRESRKIENFQVEIVSLEDLIVLKKYANRNQDKQDIQMLSKLKELGKN